jgi:hypothetical protein
VVIERDVTIRNEGTGDLCIGGVDTGCGCVKADRRGPSRLAPGESTVIRVHIDTAGREGVQDKTVTVWTNDRDRREAKFRVLCDVRLGIVAEASYVYLGRHAIGRPGTGKVRFRSPKDDVTWEITGIEGSKGAYTWTVKEVESADPALRVVELEITHPGHPKNEYVDDQLRVRTSHPDRPEILLRSQMVVVTKYYTGPAERVTFGNVGGDSPTVQRQVYVMAGEEGTEFTLRRVEVEGQGFVALEPRKSPQGWVIDVRYDGASRAAGSNVEATLVVEVDDPEARPIRLALSATVRGKR